MNIIGVKPMIPTHSGLTIQGTTTGANHSHLKFQSTIKQITDDLHFIITMNIDIDVAVNKQTGTLNTVHQFEAVLAEHNIKFTSDKDYWDMASFIQIAIAQTRVFLMQELQRLNLQILLIPIDPLGRTYQLIKEGNYAMWN